MLDIIRYLENEYRDKHRDMNDYFDEHVSKTKYRYVHAMGLLDVVNMTKLFYTNHPKTGDEEADLHSLGLLLVMLFVLGCSRGRDEANGTSNTVKMGEDVKELIKKEGLTIEQVVREGLNADKTAALVDREKLGKTRGIKVDEQEIDVVFSAFRTEDGKGLFHATEWVGNVMALTMLTHMYTHPPDEEEQVTLMAYIYGWVVGYQIDTMMAVSDAE